MNATQIVALAEFQSMTRTFTTTEYFGSESATLTFEEIASLYESCGFGPAGDLEIEGGNITAPSDVSAGRVVMAREAE